MIRSSKTNPTDDDDPWPPIEKGDSLPGAGPLAMRIFIASLVMPFVACILGYLSLRGQADVWPPAGAPELPPILWVSTALILITGALVHWAMVSVRNDREGQTRIALALVLVFGTAFMLCQMSAWADLVEAHEIPKVKMFTATFYILTGLHALHVFGGLVLQAVVTTKGLLGRYWSYHHPGVLYSAMYWHFLDGMWLVLFGVLWLGS